MSVSISHEVKIKNRSDRREAANCVHKFRNGGSISLHMARQQHDTWLRVFRETTPQVASGARSRIEVGDFTSRFADQRDWIWDGVSLARTSRPAAKAPDPPNKSFTASPNAIDAAICIATNVMADRQRARRNARGARR